MLDHWSRLFYINLTVFRIQDFGKDRIGSREMPALESAW